MFGGRGIVRRLLLFQVRDIDDVDDDEDDIYCLIEYLLGVIVFLFNFYRQLYIQCINEEIEVK